jgi:hypothetical protein
MPMGDAMKKVQSGDRLKIPAKTFNTFIDAARDFQDRQRNVGRDARPQQPRPGIVFVKNSSGEDADRFAPLGLGGILYTPEDNEPGEMN